MHVSRRLVAHGLPQKLTIFSYFLLILQKKINHTRARIRITPKIVLTRGARLPRRKHEEQAEANTEVFYDSGLRARHDCVRRARSSEHLQRMDLVISTLNPLASPQAIHHRARFTSSRSAMTRTVEFPAPPLQPNRRLQSRGV
jgi:hypothetical protein